MIVEVLVGDKTIAALYLKAFIHVVVSGIVEPFLTLKNVKFISEDHMQ